MGSKSLAYETNAAPRWFYVARQVIRPLPKKILNIFPSREKAADLVRGTLLNAPTVKLFHVIFHLNIK
jgi:hypothetical protein